MKISGNQANREEEMNEIVKTKSFWGIRNTSERPKKIKKNAKIKRNKKNKQAKVSRQKNRCSK